MPLPLTITCYEPGAGGVPSTATPIPLRGVDEYEHSISIECGYDSMRCVFTATAKEEAIDWLNRLMASAVVTSPDGVVVWEGFLNDVEVRIGRKSVNASLTDVANSVIVKYNAPSGAQTTTSTVTSAASIARFGTKQRAINFSTASSAAAAARAAVVLGQIAWPRSKQSSSAETGGGRGGITITLTFRGWWYTLDWLLTSSASTATTVTSTQVTALLAAYNATNNYFSTSTANVAATGVSDTEFIESSTSYAEQIAKLLASGNSSNQRVVWGIYEGRALTIEPWAGANPSTITYYERDGEQAIRDAYGGIVQPWDLRPNVMAQLLDLIEPAPASGPIDTMTRRYIKRVTCKIGRSGVSGTLEPDDVDSLEELLTRSDGTASTGVSARQNAIERISRRAARPVFSGTNGTVNLGGGTISTGGGSISNTGGGNVDLGTGAGIGGAGSSAITGTGTATRVAEWATSTTLQAATLIKGGAGVLTLSAASTYTLTISSSGTLALGGNTLTLDNSIRFANAGAASGDVLTYDGTKYAPATPASGVTGSGTTGRIAQWSSSSALTSATLIKSGAGVLTLSAAGAYTLTLSDSGTLDLGGFTLTVPATGTAALLGTAQTFTAAQTINSTLKVGTTGSPSIGSPRLYVRGNSTSSDTFALVVDNSSGTSVFTVQNNGTIGTAGDYRINNNLIVADERTGWTIPTGTQSRAGYNTATATLAQVAQTLYALLYDLKNWHGLIA